MGAAAPITGRLVDEHGERLPAILGFVLAGGGLAVLAIPGVPLSSLVTIVPLIPVGFGLGMLFVPTSRAALNATPLASHGRTSAILSFGRLVGAGVGAGLGGIVLSGGTDASTVHDALLLACHPVRRRGDSRVDASRDRRAAGSHAEPRSRSTAIRCTVFFGPLRGSNLIMVSGRPSTLNLRLNSRPDAAGLVRAVIGGLAAPFALRPEIVNDLKTVVSEACNNAVDHAYRGESGAIAVRLDIQLEEIEVTVRDWGGGFQELAPTGDHLRVGLPLINALADRAEFRTAPGSGTEVRMGFDLRHDPRRTDTLVHLEDSEDLEAWMPWRRGLSGDVVVTLLPRDLLPTCSSR